MGVSGMTHATKETVDAIRESRNFLKRDQYVRAEQSIADKVNAKSSADEALLYAAQAEIRSQLQDFDAAQEFAEKSLSLWEGNTEGKFQLAVAYQGRFELDRAEAIFAEIEHEKKRDARFLAQQARIHLLRHKQAKAIEFVDRAIRAAPRNAKYYALKAEIFLTGTPLAGGKVKQAINAARKAKQIDKTLPEAWRLLIKALLIAGNQEEFNKSLREARKSLKNNAAVETEVAQHLIRHKRYVEAESTLSEIVHSHGDFLPAYQALADIYIATMQWDKAVEAAYKALAIAPYSSRTWRLAGYALAKKGELTHAMGWLHKVLMADAEDILTACVLAEVLHGLHEFDAADDLYRQILQERATPALLNAYGILLMDMERAAKASEILRQAHAMDSESTHIQMNLAMALSNEGEFQAAQEIYKDIMQHKPELAAAFLNYVSITKMAEDEVVEARIKHQIEGVTDVEQEEVLHYAMVKIKEDKQDYNTAFLYLSRACALHKQRCGYNEKAEMERFRLIKSTLNQARVERLEACGNTSSRPLFVLGMPRSGTTLVEQILSAHSGIVGGGELQFMNMVLSNHAAMTNTQPIASLAKLTCEHLDTLSRDYLSLSAPIASDNEYVADKMPGNFMYIGLIALMFPNAKIIHVKRNPMATCLSCLKQRFNEGHNYSYDLVDLGHYYLAYLDLMRHWHDLFPGRIFDLEYEALTNNLEKETARLIDYCGLNWDDACLDFHKNVRAVRTASLAQVRKPIYTNSVAFWRNYEEQMEPLSRLLKEGGAFTG
jgi:tetratricopeptide (TPR) repeat protein